MGILKTKDVHIALKRDDCINYLLERFDFQQREELFEAIRKITPSGAEDLIRKLEKKQRKQRRCICQVKNGPTLSSKVCNFF